jgi:hypothetical protein
MAVTAQSAKVMIEFEDVWPDGPRPAQNGRPLTFRQRKVYDNVTPTSRGSVVFTPRFPASNGAPLMVA